MEITVFDSKGRTITMARKATNTTSTAKAAASEPVAKKTTTRSRKHVKAAAAVESVAETAAEPIVTVDPVVETKPTSEVLTAAATATFSREEVETLAYQFYLQRKGKPGSAVDDWFRAEEVLRAGA